MLKLKFIYNAVYPFTTTFDKSALKAILLV